MSDESAGPADVRRRIYDVPDAYELAFSFRDFVAEAGALMAWAAKASGREPASVIELAAGPAGHALELARRGLRAAALDISLAMCQHARQRAAGQGLALGVVEADMRDLTLPGRYDLAITLGDSVTHLHTAGDLTRWLRAVRRHLTPGGVHVVQMAHARWNAEWTVTDGNRRVHARWEPGRPDPVTGLGEVTLRLTWAAGDGGPVVIEETMTTRLWTTADLIGAASRAGGLTVAGQYGSFDGAPADGSPQAIIVLRAA